MTKHVEGKYGRKPGGKAGNLHRLKHPSNMDYLIEVKGCYCFRCQSSHRWAEPCQGKAKGV